MRRRICLPPPQHRWGSAWHGAFSVLCAPPSGQCALLRPLAPSCALLRPLAPPLLRPLAPSLCMHRKVFDVHTCTAQCPPLAGLCCVCVGGASGGMCPLSGEGMLWHVPPLWRGHAVACAPSPRWRGSNSAPLSGGTLGLSPRPPNMSPTAYWASWLPAPRNSSSINACRHGTRTGTGTGSRKQAHAGVYSFDRFGRPFHRRLLTVAAAPLSRGAPNARALALFQTSPVTVRPCPSGAYRPVSPRAPSRSTPAPWLAIGRGCHCPPFAPFFSSCCAGFRRH